MPFLSIFAHHPEPGDPVLLDWVKHQIDAIVGLGATAIVIALTLVVIAIPVAIVALYLVQRMKYGAPSPRE